MFGKLNPLTCARGPTGPRSLSRSRYARQCGSYLRHDQMALLLVVSRQCWPQHPLCTALVLSIWCIGVVIYGAVAPWVIGAWMFIMLWKHMALPAAHTGLALLGVWRRPLHR